MINSVPAYILYLAVLVVSVIISMITVYRTISIAKTRKLYDTPDNIRKIHGAGIPSLGGIGIFIAYIIAAVVFMYPAWYWVLGASAILFFTGIYDDIRNMPPSRKLMAQLVASGIAVYFADIRITSLNGLFGIEELAYWPGIALTIFLSTFFINVFNFVDGIDGLACILAILYLGLLGGLFAMMADVNTACIALALTGATIGLLYYNISPARIYMGDTGSMLLGFSIFMLSVLFLKNCSAGDTGITPILHSSQGAMLMILSVIFLPVYDAIRVFILRASRGISPLRADRTHLHYYLLDAGLGHSQAVLVIAGTNILVIALGYLLQDANSYIAIGCIILFISAIVAVIYLFRQKRLKRQQLIWP